MSEDARRLRFLLFVLFALGCGDDGVTDPADAEPDAADAADGEPDTAVAPMITAPAPPAWSCPDGWRETDTGCDPWPETGPASCPPGEAHFPGTAGCERIGPACPVGEWPEGLDPTRTLYVRAADPMVSGGDGSMASPFTSLNEAFQAATDDATIALGRGRHEFLFVSPFGDLPGLRFLGACVADTVMLVRTGTTVATANNSGGITVENLTVDGEGVGNGFQSGTSLTFTNVVFRDLLHVVGRAPVITGRNVVVRRMPDALGHVVRANRSALFERAIFEEIAGPLLLAVSTVNTVSATFEDVAIRHVADGLVLDRYGWSSRGSPTVERSTITLTVRRGELTDAPRALDLRVGDATANLSDLVVRRSALVARPPLTSFTAERLAIFDPVDVGVEGRGSESSATLRDVWIRGGARGAAGVGGHALRVRRGARMTAERVSIDGSLETAVLVDGGGSSLTLSDLSAVATRPDDAGFFGRALQVQRLGSLELARAELGDHLELGVGVFDVGSRITASDIRIADTHERACAATGCAAAGIGAGAYTGGQLELSRFVVERAALACVQVGPRGEVDLQQGVVRGCTVGINVQAEEYDVGRLQDEVRFEDNDANLDSASLPLPDSSVAVGE